MPTFDKATDDWRTKLTGGGVQITVPEWEHAFWVRPLSAAQQDEFATIMTDSKKGYAERCARGLILIAYATGDFKDKYYAADDLRKFLHFVDPDVLARVFDEAGKAITVKASEVEALESGKLQAISN